jgi:hypothetical protein
LHLWGIGHRFGDHLNHRGRGWRHWLQGWCIGDWGFVTRLAGTVILIGAGCIMGLAARQWVAAIGNSWRRI